MAIQRHSSYARARLFKDKGICRIIDANRNRLKEGLRVCEEITRFVLNSQSLTRKFKNIRHAAEGVIRRTYPSLSLISSRNSSQDVGRHIGAREAQRKHITDIFFANIQRVKESLRVLEEFTKLIDKRNAASLKALRYRLYELEKESVGEIPALRDH